MDPLVIFVILSATGFILIGIYYASRRPGEIVPKPMTFWRTVWAVVMAEWMVATVITVFYEISR